MSILGPTHAQFPRVEALRSAMRDALVSAEPFAGVPLRLEMSMYRALCRADGLNLINGVADVIQRRCAAAYRSDVWLIDDDVNIRAFAYSEEAADHDWYDLMISTLESPH